jgi:outer membrane immunogenic protein
MARFLIAVFAIFAVVLVDSAPTIAGPGLEPPPKSRPRPPIKPKPKLEIAVTNWAGPYIEGSLGYAFSDRNSALASLGAGTNFQFGSTVLGAEVGVDRLNASSNFSCAPNVLCGFDSRWMMTAQGMVGYAVNRYLPYVTVGAAAADFSSAIPIGNATTSKIGVLFGGGVKIDLGHRLSSNIEYRWVDFGPIPWAIAPHDGAFGEIRFGLSYHFSPDGLDDRSH